MDGARSPTDLASAAAAGGWSTLALADQNNLYALPELADAAAAAGVKALAAASLETGGVALRAYCLDRRGYARLCALLTRILAVEVPRRRLRLPPDVAEEEARASPSAEELLPGRSQAPVESGIGGPPAKAYRQGRRGREASAAGEGGSRPRGPSSDFDLLAELREGGWEGLALSSPDPKVLAALASGRALAGARGAPGRLYAALPLGLPQEGPARAGRELGLPLLAEHPARFASPGDAALWRLARAVEERRTLAGLERESRPDPPGASLVAASRAAALLSAFPEALEAARALAEEAAPAASFFADPPVFPAYRGLPDEESFFLLRSLCAEGARRRYGPHALEGRVALEGRHAPEGGGAAGGPRLRARLERELRIIRDKGFSAYFLVVRDIVARCPRTCGRGSAASSLVSYLLGLTHGDPLEHDLFFERFLNEGRRDPPDIDIDFPWDERPAVLASVFADYEGRAAMVADHCGFSERSSLRESALALGMGEEDLRAASRALRLGALEELSPELLGLARSIRGMPRYIGTHPGGVVITPGPIADYCHVQISPAGLPVLGWEKDGTERAGLVKIDLLGNRSLAVLRDCIELVNRGAAATEPGGKAAPAPLAWDFKGAEEDPETRRLVESGRSMGVFYIESPATRQLLLKMGTVDYRRLVAASSIIRPAANKWINEYVRRLRGGSWRRLPAPVEETLKETYGIMVYQEDVSRVAMAAAGFDAAEADGLRKVLTKKRKGGALEDFKGRFLAGCSASGIAERDSGELWDMMLSFDGYSFCKAHSASYALVSYRLAWMKAHHPAIFMASVVNNGGGFYGVQAYLGEARRLGLNILPPHVNSSGAGYLVEEGASPCAPAAIMDDRRALRVGLSQLRDLSRACLDRLLAARGAAKGGRFGSLAEFDALVAPKQSELRALARSGCLDGLPARPGGPPLGRPQALWALHRIRSRPGARKGAAQENELIEDSWEPPAWVRDYSRSTRLADEARLLGLVLAGVPAALFAGRAALVAGRRGLPPPGLSTRLSEEQGHRLCLAGTAVAGKEVSTKGGESMAFYTFEDEAGLFEAVFFPQAYAKALPTLEGNSAVLLVGTARSEYGAASLHVEEAFGLNKPD
jgi:error-prone DNA polymerase